MKILFLDIDGVLNRCGKSNQGLEEDKVEMLKDILGATGAKVVLSSTWRKFERTKKRVRKMLHSIGHDLHGSTPVNDMKALALGALRYGHRQSEAMKSRHGSRPITKLNHAL